MDKEKFIELVTKYLSNEATSDDKEQLSILLKNSEYSKLFAWISNNWHDYKGDQDTFYFNIDRGVAKLTEKIQEHESSFSWGKDKTPSFSHHNNLFKIAVSVMFVIFFSAASLYYFDSLEKTPQKIVLNEKITLPGQKSILTLFDGTKITLNANSKLKYPTHFGEFSREIYLEGEAYFEVIRNTKKPFIVHTSKISTTVLGTKFNVTAFPEDKKIRVSLVEGKVLVTDNSEKKESANISLTPKQQYIYDVYKKRGIVKEFKILEEIGWKDNTFIFDNEPLENVLIKLERAFGVKLEIVNKNVKDYKLKANFKNESFWAIIETIKYATELEYIIVSKNNELEKVIFQNVNY